MKKEKMTFSNLKNALSRTEMKTIMAGSANPSCLDSCTAGPVVDAYKCVGACQVCYSNGGGNRFCVTRIS